jgi:hypothetical protein
MAAGDAQRVWFPEMVERLRSQWHQGMSFDALVELRDELDAILQQIRSERHIRTTVMKCPRCGSIFSSKDEPERAGEEIESRVSFPMKC